MVSRYLRGCVRFTAPCPFGPFGPHSKFEALLAKAFSLKQTKKPKSNTSSYYRKNQILTFQENSLWFL